MTLIGSMVGHIRVQSLLGQGGMGEVYVGYDETLDRRVALKSILADRRLHADAKARFLREARVLSQLDHPNICRIYDYLERDECDFLVLELIAGRNLQTAIREGLARDQQLRVAEQVAAALVAAHAEGVVHRDLKPSNVMLTDADEVKVLDFGMARLVRERPARPPSAPVERSPEPPLPPTEPAFGRPPPAPPWATPTLIEATAATLGEMQFFRAEPGICEDDERLETGRGAIVGTLAYMSPEQARGEPATTASDMYSFGLLLQALFTGRPPYPADLAGTELLQRARRAETLPVAGIPKDLAALVERLKSVAPAARPTAVETAARLRWIRDTPKRRLRRLAAAAVLLVAVLGGLKYTLDLRHERAIAVAARQEAERRRDQAEDLIQFMLGDLRGRLEPVGRLDALDGVADKALDYFATVRAEELTDADLFRRSRALTQIGEVRTAQGNLPAARRSLGEAHALARDLVARQPDNGEWLMGLGAIEFWIGNAHWLQGDLAAAQKRFEAYLDVAERLVRLDDVKPDWRLEQAYAHSNLGSVQEARGDVDGALAHFHQTVALKRQLARSDPANPRWQKELASSLSWLGETLLGRGDLAAASEQYEAGRAVVARLVALEPENTQYQLLLGIAHYKLGSVLESLGAEAEARRQFEQSVAVHGRLGELDPANANWRRELAAAQQRLGLALVRGDADAGLRHLRRAAQSLRELQRGDVSNAERRLDLVRARMDLGRGLLAAGAAAAAAAEVREALAALPLAAA
ncbi:MAG TPA: protein kinase, partial [Thermoanaerobaculia bacterium]